MKLRFDPCVLNLIWKWDTKDPKRIKDHINFINFGIKKFTKKHPRKKTLMIECYNFLDPMEWGATILWGWFPTRQLQDPTVTSLNSHTLLFWEIDFFNYVKTSKFGKKTLGILGINAYELEMDNFLCH
jgi:hypothetical protein